MHPDSFIDSGSGSIILGCIPNGIQGFNNQKLKKIYSWKTKLIEFWSKIAIYLSLGPHKGRSSYRRSLQPAKENIQNFKTWNFFNFSYFFGSILSSWIWIWIPNPDPDPLTWLNPVPIWIRSEILPQSFVNFGSGNGRFWTCFFNHRRKATFVWRAWYP
jgi:hypothetical protein